jgi:hypothetical protein
MGVAEQGDFKTPEIGRDEFVPDGEAGDFRPIGLNMFRIIISAQPRKQGKSSGFPQSFQKGSPRHFFWHFSVPFQQFIDNSILAKEIGERKGVFRGFYEEKSAAGKPPAADGAASRPSVPNLLIPEKAFSG